MLTPKTAAIAAIKEAVRLFVVLMLFLIWTGIITQYIETRTPEIISEQYQQALQRWRARW